MALLNEASVSINGQPISVVEGGVPEIPLCVQANQTSFGSIVLSGTVGSIPAGKDCEILFAGFGVALQYGEDIDTVQNTYLTNDSGPGGPTIGKTETATRVVTSRRELCLFRVDIKIGGTIIFSSYSESNPILLKIPATGSSRTITVEVSVVSSNTAFYKLAYAVTYRLVTT